METIDTRLLGAIETGDTTEISTLLNIELINFHARDANGNTVLHHTVENKLLTESKIIEILEIFLDRGVDLKIKNQYGETILNTVIDNRMRDVIDFLVNYDVTTSHRYNYIDDFISKEYDKFWVMEGTVIDSIRCNREIMETESVSYIEWLILKGIDLTCEEERRSLYSHPYKDKTYEPKTNILIHAIKNDLLHILPVLLKYSKVGNYGDKRNQTLLDLFYDDEEFMQHRRSADTADWYIHYRQRYAPTIIKMLLDRGCSALDADENGWTPLRTAIESGEDPTIIEILVNHVPAGCDKSSLARTLFDEMIISQWSDSRIESYSKILNNLIAKGIDVNEKNKSGDWPVQCAVRLKNLGAAKVLKNNGVDFSVLTDNGSNLLHILAAKDGKHIDCMDSEDIYDYLVSQGYQENATVRDFGELTDGGRNVWYRLPLGQDCKQCKKPVDCKKNEISLFDFLVNEGCEENAMNAEGDYVLHVAAKFGYLAIVQKLIDRGNRVDCRNNEMQTPLHLAATNKEANDVVEFLINKGAKVNARDINGRTPLHYAAYIRRENVKILKSLLKNGACVNAKDNAGETPLAKVTYKNSQSNLEELLKHGALYSSHDPIGTITIFNRHVFYDLSIHFQKLIIAGLPCRKEYKDFAKSLESVTINYNSNSLKEVQTLKDNFIDSQTSLYDFLHMNLHSRFIHINNEKLKNIVNCPEIKKRFPNYFVLILASYHEAVARKALIGTAKEAWFELTEIELPDICIERIICFLSDEDLVILIDN